MINRSCLKMTFLGANDRLYRVENKSFTERQIAGAIAAQCCSSFSYKEVYMAANFCWNK